MGGVDRPLAAGCFGEPLNCAIRLRRHVSFRRYDEDGFVVATEICARRPGSPKSFGHTLVTYAVGQRGAREEQAYENDNGAHLAHAKSTNLTPTL